MHELGVLGRYLPEWAAITCLVQYDVYHKFTADQHSLLAVEYLEALAPGQSAESETIASVLNDVERPDLLILGMLLHDIGKGAGKGHVAKGVPLIQALAGRIGLPPEDADRVTFLVAHHLTMSHTAQRRDIDDPKTVESLAEACRTPERLRMLYLLTFADMRAVGPGVMTRWQAQMLGELFTRTLARLTAGEVRRPSRDAVAARVWDVMQHEGAKGAVSAHLAMLSDRYVATTSPQRIAAHIRLLERLDEHVIATELFQHPDLDSAELVIATRDVPGLFSLIAGTLAAHGINILSAQIHTRADGIAIDTFQVNDPAGEPVTDQARWRGTLDALRHVIGGEQTVEALLARRRTARAQPEGVAGPPKITIDNHLSDTHTVIEVKCPDRLGLLYAITRALSAQGLDIGSARIATEIDQAYDTFYVTDRQGARVEDAAAMTRIRDALDEALLKPLGC
jgi:[protein-PII] uridylyltransferase